jgi:hypothetical protein
MRRRVSGLLLLILASARLVSAQQPELSISAGTPSAELGAAITMQDPRDVNGRPQCEQYSLPCASGKEFGDVGWALSTAFNFTEKFGLVGEVAGFENTWLEPGHSHDTVNQVHSLVGGPRATSRFMHTGGTNPNDTRLFVQFLAGVQVSDLTPIRFAMRPGGGIDILTRTGLIVRLGLDYTFTSPDGRDLSGGRFFAGVVVAVPGR